jgi:hypothetical protein
MRYLRGGGEERAKAGTGGDAETRRYGDKRKRGQAPRRWRGSEPVPVFASQSPLSGAHQGFFTWQARPVRVT